MVAKIACFFTHAIIGLLISVSSRFCSCFLQVGAALSFDLLKYDESNHTAFLRVVSK